MHFLSISQVLFHHTGGFSYMNTLYHSCRCMDIHLYVVDSLVTTLTHRHTHTHTHTHTEQVSVLHINTHTTLHVHYCKSSLISYVHVRTPDSLHRLHGTSPAIYRPKSRATQINRHSVLKWGYLGRPKY